MKFIMWEKKALLGMTVVTVAFVGSIGIIGHRNLWFESKNHYSTHILDADGLREGSLVTMSGLRVGEVTALHVSDDNRVEVVFSVKKSLHHKIREDSEARLNRAFIIGEKRIDILPGNKDMPEVPNNGHIVGYDSTEITDLIAGKKIGPIFKRFEKLSGGFDKWTEALRLLTEKFDPKDLIKTYTLLLPTLENISTLTRELLILTEILRAVKGDIIDNKLAVNSLKNANALLEPLAKQKDVVTKILINSSYILAPLAKRKTGLSKTLSNVNKTLGNVNKTLASTNKILIPLAKRNDIVGRFLDNANAIIAPVAQRKALLKQILDNIQVISKDLAANPSFSKDVIEALKEITITLKAIQKTWILSSHVEEVKKKK